VSKKIFNLTHSGDTVHLAPGTKRISGEAFSVMMTAKELLSHAQEDAEKYKIEVTADIEVLKEQAQREGCEAGYQEWSNHVAELETEIKNVNEEVQKVVVPLALQAAKKIVGREIELDDSVAVDIVSSSLKAVSQHKSILIYVNKKDLQVLEKHKPQLQQIFEHLESLSIRDRDDIEPGGCVIETEAGIINAQLSNRWDALEQAFTAFLGTNDQLTHAAEAVSSEESDDDEEADEEQEEE